MSKLILPGKTSGEIYLCIKCFSQREPNDALFVASFPVKLPLNISHNFLAQGAPFSSTTHTGCK